MNEQMKQQLAKYMKADGYYDIAAIRQDLAAQGFNTRPSFDDIFGDSDDHDANDQPISKTELHPMWQAAVDANEAKENADAVPVQDILAKTDEQITETEWKQLISAGLAETYYPDTAEDIDLPLTYRRTWRAKQYVTPTEEELAKRGL